MPTIKKAKNVFKSMYDRHNKFGKAAIKAGFISEFKTTAYAFDNRVRSERFTPAAPVEIEWLQSFQVTYPASCVQNTNFKRQRLTVPQ